jgi:hypothetical protein
VVTPEVPADPAADKRWRVTLTIFAWLYIVQSALGIATGLIGMASSSLIDPGTFTGQLGPLMDRSNIRMVNELMRSAVVINQIATAANVVLLLASIGVLLRRKWGWYSFVIFHVASVPATFIWGLPILQKILGMLDPTRAQSFSLLITFLLALIPVLVVGFLLSKGILVQFERPKPAAQAQV